MDFHTAINSGDKKIPTDILDDLSSRFIINVPEEERADLIRVFFQIELAYWFYLDFYCTNRSDLPTCHMREFSYIIFNHIPSLRSHVSKIDSVFAQWRSYKMSVPTFGAMLLNSKWDKVLLVQGFFSKASWGFPKGKVNNQEDPQICAVREVLEETGFDISNLIDETHYIEHHFNDQLIRLYIVPGVPEDITFQPKTRNEIKNIAWFNISDLPTNKYEQLPKHLGLGPSAFFMVTPMIRKLKKWIRDHQELSNEARVSSPESSNEENPTSNTPRESSREREQKIFAALSSNKLLEYRNMRKKDPVTPDNAHIKKRTWALERERTRTPTERAQIPYTRPTYTPPPRFQKMLNQNPDFVAQPRPYRIQLQSKMDEQNQKKSDNKITVTRVPVVFGDTEKPIIVPSKSWTNFVLDKKAIIACFNIHLRNSSLSS